MTAPPTARARSPRRSERVGRAFSRPSTARESSASARPTSPAFVPPCAPGPRPSGRWTPTSPTRLPTSPNSSKPWKRPTRSSARATSRGASLTSAGASPACSSPGLATSTPGRSSACTCKTQPEASASGGAKHCWGCRSIASSPMDTCSRWKWPTWRSASATACMRLRSTLKIAGSAAPRCRCASSWRHRCASGMCSCFTAASPRPIACRPLDAASRGGAQQTLPLLQAKILRPTVGAEPRRLDPPRHHIPFHAQAARERVAQLLALLIEPGARQEEERVDEVGRDPWALMDAHHQDRRVHGRGRVKCAGGDPPRHHGGSIQLNAESQQAVFPGLGCHPLRHFLLNGEHEPGGACRRLEQPSKKVRGDVVRNVGDHTVGRAADEAGQIEAQDVPLDQLYVRPVGHGLAQRRDQARVNLDGDHFSGLRGELEGKRAHSCADFEDSFVPGQLGRRHDALERRRFEEEVLPEPLVGANSVAPQQAAEIGPRFGRARRPPARAHGKIQTILPGGGTGVRKYTVTYWCQFTKSWSS